MEALERLAAGDLVPVVTSYRDVLRANQDAINRLNVSPVPDGHTGTTMALTSGSGVAELGGGGGGGGGGAGARPRGWLRGHKQAGVVAAGGAGVVRLFGAVVSVVGGGEMATSFAAPAGGPAGGGRTRSGPGSGAGPD